MPVRFSTYPCSLGHLPKRPHQPGAFPLMCLSAFAIVPEGDTMRSSQVAVVIKNHSRFLSQSWRVGSVAFYPERQIFLAGSSPLSDATLLMYSGAYDLGAIAASAELKPHLLRLGWIHAPNAVLVCNSGAQGRQCDSGQKQVFLLLTSVRAVKHLDELLLATIPLNYPDNTSI